MQSIKKKQFIKINYLVSTKKNLKIHTNTCTIHYYLIPLGIGYVDPPAFMWKNNEIIFIFLTYKFVYYEKIY